MTIGYRLLTALACLCLVASALPGPAAAKKLYKYQDSNGRWHFSDKPPADQIEQVETEQLKVTRRGHKVAVVRRGVESEPVFYIINEYRGPVELELSLGQGSLNVTTTPGLPQRFVVPGASEIRAARLRPLAPGRTWRYEVGYRLMLGAPGAEHRPDSPYRVPFPVDRTFPVTQAFNGPFSHNDEANRHAVDIGMPEGTPVLAARDGVVMDVANDFFSGGADADRYMDRANVIRVLHEDGTMGVYGHLSLESARVAPGARVRAGQMLARSGNTGFSTGPHLHFVIQKNAGMRLVSVPFEFAGQGGVGYTPEASTLITAFEQ